MDPLTDVDVTKSSQALPELFNLALVNLLLLALVVLVAALLLGVEAQVLQKDDLTVLGAVDSVLDRLADAVVCESYALAEQLLKLGNNRLETVLGVWLSVWATKMRHEDDSLCAIFNCVFDCGKSADDALVVGDVLVAV